MRLPSEYGFTVLEPSLLLDQAGVRAPALGPCQAGVRDEEEEEAPAPPDQAGVRPPVGLADQAGVRLPFWAAELERGVREPEKSVGGPAREGRNDVLLLV